MKSGVLVSAAMLALLSVSSAPSTQPAPPRMVYSTEVTGEVAIKIALVNPHYPVNLADEASTLASDVNSERVKRGLPALVRDDMLDRFAYAKAVEMAARGYFGHTDTNGVTFQDRLHAWYWPTDYAAENIAFDWDETHAHSAFMESPPHARNLLDRNEKKIGVAVVNVGDRESFYVEDFSEK